MVRISVVICLIVAVVTHCSRDVKAEDFHTKIMNAFYGTNHTGWSDECGCDQTYFHYIASELTIVIALELIHIIVAIVAFVKLWKKDVSTLRM